MGQQQILLIILGLVVVGIAVLIGIEMFSEDSTPNVVPKITEQDFGTFTIMTEPAYCPSAGLNCALAKNAHNSYLTVFFPHDDAIKKGTKVTVTKTSVQSDNIPLQPLYTARKQ